MLNYLILIISTLMATGKSLFCKAIGVGSYSKREAMLLNFKSFAVAFICSLLFLISQKRGLFNISVFSLVLSVFFGLSVAITQVMQARAMGNGPASIVTLIYSCGFLIPIFYGLPVWGEDVSVFQWIGIALLVVSIGLIVIKGDSVRSLAAWLPFAIIAMLGSGINAIFQKTHQYSSYADELPLFLAYSLFFSALFTGLTALLTRKEAIKPQSKKSLKSIVVPICLGVCVGALNLLNLNLSGKIPSVILFPIYNVGSLLLTTIVSAIIYKDKISKRQSIGFAIGIVAILIVGLL